MHTTQFPFSPVEDESQPNPHQVPLEIGSELYVFEVFRPSRDISYSDEGSLWYRGYVVASKQATSALASVGDSTDSADNPAPQDQPGVDEPSVTVGIFPATHCLIKERLEDTDARLEEVRQAADITSLETGLGRRQKAQLATLLEEDESQDEDLLSGIVNNLQTPSKARNRASLVDGRLSGHKRSESSSSLAEQIAGPSLGVEDRPPPPLPSLKTGDETAAGLDEPLVDEIACSLRGSANLLYTHLYQRNYSKFHEVKAAIDDLHLGRRQLLNGTLSTDELQRLRQSLVDKLVLVNISQGLDIVVRHPQWGALADVEAHEAVDERAWMSAVRMYKLGVELAYTDPKTGKRPLGSHSILGPSTEFPRPAQRTAGKQHQQNTASHASELSTFYHVLVDLKAFVASPCAPGETAELIFSLYNKSEKRFLTEECCIVVNHQGGQSCQSSVNDNVELIQHFSYHSASRRTTGSSKNIVQRSVSARCPRYSGPCMSHRHQRSSQAISYSFQWQIIEFYFEFAIWLSATAVVGFLRFASSTIGNFLRRPARAFA